MFSNLKEILDDLKSGKIVCISDTEDIENEIDMCCLGEYATPENINYMAHNACGFICNVLPHNICVKKGIDYLEQKGIIKDLRDTPFAAFVDLITCDTGISAYERSQTIIELSCSDKDLSYFVGGHTPVLHAKEGLLKERLGHTEMSSQLSFLAGSNGTAVICEILSEDGTMLRVNDFEEFNKNKGLKIYSLSQLLKELKIS